MSLVESTEEKLASWNSVKGDGSRTYHGTLPPTTTVTYPKILYKVIHGTALDQIKIRLGIAARNR
jgi:hypothetical protein